MSKGVSQSGILCLRQTGTTSIFQRWGQSYQFW